eukprot:UN24064
MWLVLEKQGVLVFGNNEDVDSKEVKIPFTNEPFGITEKEDGTPIIEKRFGSPILEEQFAVTNRGNQAIVLEDLFFVEPGEEDSSKFLNGCGNGIYEDGKQIDNYGYSELDVGKSGHKPLNTEDGYEQESTYSESYSNVSKESYSSYGLSLL